MKSFFAQLLGIVLIIQLTACGGGGDSGGSTTPPTPANVAPTANAGTDQTVDEQTTVTLSGSGTDSDGSISSYSWTQTGGTGVTISAADAASSTFETPTTTSQLSLSFQLTVTDDDGATDNDTIDIVVNPVNAGPIANAGNAQTVNERDTVTLAGTATDDDGTVVSTIWTQTGGSAVTLTNGSTLSASFTAPEVNQETDFSWELRVTDNEGGVSSDSITITINPFFPSLETKPIAFTSTAFTEASIDTSNYSVTGFVSETILTPSNNLSIELSDAREGQLVFISDQNEALVTVAFVDAAAYEAGNFDITPESIADGILLSVPKMMSIDREGRFEILDQARNNAKYSILVTAIKDGIANSIASFINPEESIDVWQPAFDIINEIFTANITQKSLLKAEGMSKAGQLDTTIPYIQDTTSTDIIEIVNPTMMFYNYTFDSNQHDYLISGKDQAWKFSWSTLLESTLPNSELFGYGLGQSSVRFDAGWVKAPIGNLVRGMCIALDMALYCPITSKQIENALEGNVFTFDNVPDFTQANSYKEVLSLIISYFDPATHPDRLEKFVNFAFKNVKKSKAKYLKLAKRLNVVAYVANIVIDGTQSAIPFLWDIYTKPVVIDCTIDNQASSFSFTCDNQAPIAAISRSPLGYAAINQELTFTAENTSDDSDSLEVLEVRWDFENDGTYDTSWSTSNKWVTHAFTSAGTYAVKLDVRDSEGLTDSTIMDVIVKADNSGGSKFSVTPTSYDSTVTDIDTIVSNEYGSGYRVADWNDLVSFVNDGGDIQDLWTSLGVNAAMVSRDGNRFYSGTRQYYLDWSDRPGQTPYGSFLSHGNLGQLYLGSWQVNIPILIIKP